MKQNEFKPTKPFTRREAIEKLLAGAAAGTIWPLLGAGHMQQLAKNPEMLHQIASVETSEHWVPLFLNEQQNRTLVAASERILPGATGAQVNRFIDLLLSVDTPQNQATFVAGLVEVDKHSTRLFGHTFRELPSDKQDQVLTGMSRPGPQKEDFDRLREWATLAYYSSEKGMRELGWTENRAFKTFPVCELAPEH